MRMVVMATDGKYKWCGMCCHPRMIRRGLEPQSMGWYFEHVSRYLCDDHESERQRYHSVIEYIRLEYIHALDNFDWEINIDNSEGIESTDAFDFHPAHEMIISFARLIK